MFEFKEIVIPVLSDSALSWLAWFGVFWVCFGITLYAIVNIIELFHPWVTAEDFRKWGQNPLFTVVCALIWPVCIYQIVKDISTIRKHDDIRRRREKLASLAHEFGGDVFYGSDHIPYVNFDMSEASREKVRLFNKIAKAIMG